MSTPLYWVIGVLVFIGLIFLLGYVIEKYGNEAGNPVGFLLLIFCICYGGYGLFSTEEIKRTELTPQSVVVDGNKRFKTVVFDDGDTLTLWDAPSVNNPIKIFEVKSRCPMGIKITTKKTEVVYEKEDQ